MRVPHGGHRLIAGDHLSVLVPPRIGAAAERIGAALHARFIAVIDARHARHAENKAEHQLFAQRADHPLFRRKAMVRALIAGNVAAVVSGQHVENARPVVAAHQVHQRIKERLGIILRQRRKLSGNGGRVLLSR